MSDFLPITSEQIADDAVKAYEAGAAIAHVHARNPEVGKPHSNMNVFREITTDIKSRCNMVVCVTTGGAGTTEERIVVVLEFKPEPASMNCGSLSGTAVPMWERMKSKPFKYEWEDEHLKREF